ncbi:MAG: hypothetical protein V3T63_01180 [Nitrosopumilaceae archaeon]
MKSSKKALVIFLIIGVASFGYIQYASATQIGVIVTESHLLEKNDSGSTYNVELEFDNPSLLVLNAGTTVFIISVEGQKVADGVLEPFVLPAMGKVTVEGTYQTNQKSESVEDEEISMVTISGVTKYDVFFTSIDVPFIYFPPEEQAREFIQQN